jgi:hypothetical protein
MLLAVMAKKPYVELAGIASMIDFLTESDPQRRQNQTRTGRQSYHLEKAGRFRIYRPSVLKTAAS